MQALKAFKAAYEFEITFHAEELNIAAVMASASCSKDEAAAVIRERAIQETAMERRRRQDNADAARAKAPVVAAAAESAVVVAKVSLLALFRVI